MAEPESIAIQLGIVFLILGLLHVLHRVAKSLYVEGKPNEWVLLIRNGQMVRAGVGLSCFKGFMD